MPRRFLSFLSVSGVPLLGLGALLLCLWHTSAPAPPAAGVGEMMMLQDPDPRLDKSLTICLRQEARDVARCRREARSADLIGAVADYNLVASECTPAVFERTGLPSSVEP